MAKRQQTIKSEIFRILTWSGVEVRALACSLTLLSDLTASCVCVNDGLEDASKDDSSGLELEASLPALPSTVYL